MMILDKEQKYTLTSEEAHQFVDEYDFSNWNDLIAKEKEALDKVNRWAALTVGKSGFVTIVNLPVLISLAIYATEKKYDDAKCKLWFETFAFTYGTKELEGKGYYEIYNTALADMKKSCQPRPKLVF